MKLSNFSIRARIYLSMLVLIILSFLAIGGFTYHHFKTQNEAYHQSKLQRKENAVIKSIGYFLENEGIYENPDSIMVVFADKITELADINNLDINIYNLKGELLISSHTSSFEKGFFVFQLNDEIINSLKSGAERLVYSEKVDSIQILSAYRYMTNTNNEPIAIINLPYLKDKDNSDQDLTLFITRLAEIYILLFMAGSFIAFFLSRYITGTLNTIANRLQQIDLEKKNEPIKWNIKDEVGTLINEYNRMLAELEKSAELLAKSERESAWREMAKQVAHEIKNPLTPMKLNLQHLERTLQVTGDDKAKFQKFANTMIEQIDELSNIASAFSNFAEMPKAEVKQMNLVETTSQVVDLFKESIEAELNFDTNEHSANILGDKGQIARAINNLIKNAAQATEAIKEPKIIVTVEKIADFYRVSVTDNGIGMDEEEIKKAFEPNFTTKNSGMGLGLPMVKNIVQNAGGKVELQSEKGRGSTVCVYFPVLS